jgi:hypothetical protein
VAPQIVVGDEVQSRNTNNADGRPSTVVLAETMTRGNAKFTNLAPRSTNALSPHVPSRKQKSMMNRFSRVESQLPKSKVSYKEEGQGRAVQ